MIDIKAYGKIENGAFYPRNSRVYLQQMKDAGNVMDCLIHITGANKRTVDQNSYGWAVCNQIAVRMKQDGWRVTAANVYRRVEQTYCVEEKMNDRTDRVEEFITPLKEQPTDKFFEIIEQVRQNAMQRYPDIHIDTPAEHYGMSEKNYDLWKQGIMSFNEARAKS